MASITSWILRHRLIVGTFWIIVAFVGLASSGSATKALSRQGGLPAGYEGVDTNTAIQHSFGTGGATAALVPVIVLPRGVTVDSPGIMGQLGSAFAAVQAALPHSRVISYASTGNRAFISADGRTTFGLVYAYARPDALAAAPPVQPIARALAAHPIAGARTHVTGRDALASWSNGGGGAGVLTETLLGGLGALFILTLVFGSFLAIVPLLMAMVAIPTTFLLVWGRTTVTDVSFIVEFLIALIGLGVAIDYSLLIVTRWREERAYGHDNTEAVRLAMTTAGRSVVFSGTTVAISLLALLATPSDASALAGQLSRVDGVRGVVTPATAAWRHEGSALIDVLPASDSTSAQGRATLDAVRQAAHAGPTPAHVGGVAAADADFVGAVYGNFLLMVALIALVTFVLLVRAFRSLLLPLKALLLNVISVGAAWGAMTLVWQNGHGSAQFWGNPATGSITSWIPLMVFAFLFGLSMDYEVFILARMREEYDRTGSTDAAVVGGIGHTGRLVTSAALILVLAFVVMAAIPMTDTKVMATGLAAGILLDATVVRMLLVPALVSLFGRWNWWLPAFPARLLRVQPSGVVARPASITSGRRSQAA